MNVIARFEFAYYDVVAKHFSHRDSHHDVFIFIMFWISNLVTTYERLLGDFIVVCSLTAYFSYPALLHNFGSNLKRIHIRFVDVCFGYMQLLLSFEFWFGLVCLFNAISILMGYLMPKLKAMDCGIVVSEFVLQSRYYVHFQTNNLGKGMNPLILPAMG